MERGKFPSHLLLDPCTFPGLSSLTRSDVIRKAQRNVKWIQKVMTDPGPKALSLSFDQPGFYLLLTGQADPMRGKRGPGVPGLVTTFGYIPLGYPLWASYLSSIGALASYNRGLVL